MRKVIFDIETKNTFAEVGTRDPALLDLSLVSIHDSESDSISSYFEEDLGRLWPIIERADVLIGFNSDHFDIPILNKYYPGDLGNIKSLDLLAEIRSSLGRRIGLDAIAEATLGIKKSGHGLQAIEWWRSGELEKLQLYCEQDVRVTKSVYDFAFENRYLKFKADDGLRKIPLNTKDWDTPQEKSITHTLPF
ncbi:MAG: ribonuclease H-like domain-containing protein [Candidatus Paceibacterota bacterium]